MDICRRILDSMCGCLRCRLDAEVYQKIVVQAVRSTHMGNTIDTAAVLFSRRGRVGEL